MFMSINILPVAVIRIAEGSVAVITGSSVIKIRVMSCGLTTRMIIKGRNTSMPNFRDILFIILIPSVFPSP